MYTFQEFETHVSDRADFIGTLIAEHEASAAVRMARAADNYDRQQNETINRYARYLYSDNGAKIIDKTVSNNRIASNFFHRLNTQRVTYSLGNGVEFSNENTKERLGQDFDTRLQEAAYNALIHGESFLFWNLDHVHVFKLTEFIPLLDEYTGVLMAGVRYWQIDSKRPVVAVLYEADGFSRYIKEKNSAHFVLQEEKRAFKITYQQTAVDEPEVVSADNYSALPIIPLWGSKLHQSTLAGMRAQIDAYDLVKSGFANDLDDCASIYWIISGADGMTPGDLSRFRQRLKLQHIAQAEENDVRPYTQEIPHAARVAFLDDMRRSIYEDFGGMDTKAIGAGATATEINSAYQPLDENADDLEFQIIETVQQLLALEGIEDTPIFKRNRISNQTEQTTMVLSAANYLDDETVLRKLPWISVDEIDDIMGRRDAADLARFSAVMAADDGTGNSGAGDGE